MEKAREFTRQKKKSQALMCLKKKKMFEQQLERMDALISRVLEQRNMLESSRLPLECWVQCRMQQRHRKRLCRCAATTRPWISLS